VTALGVHSSVFKKSVYRDEEWYEFTTHSVQTTRTGGPAIMTEYFGGDIVEGKISEWSVTERLEMAQNFVSHKRLGSYIFDDETDNWISVPDEFPA